MYACMYACMYVCIGKFTAAVECCNAVAAVLKSRSCIVSHSVESGHCRLEPLEPNVIERLGSWCTGMLVYCTHICILTRPLDMLTIVVCMSSPNCWKLTVLKRLTTLLDEKDISWIKCWIHCTLYKVKCWSKTLIYTHNVCWTENHCWIQLVLVVLLTSLLHAQLR